jgi:hypothetical protein
MKKSRKPWVAKLRPEMKPEVGLDPKGRGKMLCPTPLLVAEEIKRIPPGNVLKVSELRRRLAHRFGADLTCPLMTGIFFNIIAGAAEEQLAAGQSPVAPYWRVILDDGTLNPKSPPGPAQQAVRLQAEGHAITSRRSKLLVANVENQLAKSPK